MRATVVVTTAASKRWSTVTRRSGTGPIITSAREMWKQRLSSANYVGRSSRLSPERGPPIVAASPPPGGHGKREEADHETRSSGDSDAWVDRRTGSRGWRPLAGARLIKTPIATDRYRESVSLRL